MGWPPPFGMDLHGARGEIWIDPDLLEGFAAILGQVADGISGFARMVGQAMEPLALPPGPPLASPLTGPGGGLPLDAAEAVGWPSIYGAVVDGLRAAGQDLVGRAAKMREANAGMCPAGPGPVFVFPDVDAATTAGRDDGNAAAKILDRRSTPNGELEDLAGWLEETSERALDSGYAAGVLHQIGPKRIAEAVDVAVRAGPEARERMFELIASASRGGTLDPKVEAALMRSPHLRLLAQSDVEYSEAFAAHMANTLLDPNRVTFDSDPMIPGPSKADLQAAHDLIER